MTNREPTEDLARRVLKGTFGIVPIVAGFDKFTNLLADWPRYVAPAAAAVLPVSPEVFMGLVGVVEIAAGLMVLSRFTAIGAYVVAAWLVGVALNLVAAGFLDVAVRDLVMAAAAFALARLEAARQAAEGAAPADQDGRERLHVRARAAG
jgi:hypothetical protein